MGSFWQLYSYEPHQWSAIFSGGAPEAKKHLVSGVWDGGEAELPDPEVNLSGYLDALWESAPSGLCELAERVARDGISYRGLSSEDAGLLDSMVVGAFTAEGLEPWLKCRVEHDMGLSLREIDELLSRRETVRVGGILGFGGVVSVGHPTAVVQWLRAGRRYRTSETTAPEARYVIFDHEEAKAGISDLAGLLAVDRAWKPPEFEASIRHELLGALERAVAANRHFAATYCP